MIRRYFRISLLSSSALAWMLHNSAGGLPSLAAYLSPLVGPLMLAAAFAFWRVGVRHYGGTGT